MPKAMDEVYFHEDDYCQQELLPLSAMEFCGQQITEIDEFATAHKAPDGVGWTEMYMREDSPKKLVDLGITVSTLRETMTEHLREVPVIYTGYSSHRELCKHTVGFGLDADCIVYAEWNEANVVKTIWTGLFTPHANELQRVVAALQQLGQRFPLLYVDWAWSFATPVDQSPSLKDRLVSKVTEISRRMEQKD